MRKTRIKPISKKQAEKLKVWRKITDLKCEELDYICQWCGKRGDRTDSGDMFFLGGHHKDKNRNNNTAENCYVVHNVCHLFIHDNNVKVDIHPTKDLWELWE